MVNYMISYATKAEKDVCDAMKDVKNNIMDDVNKTARDKLKTLGNVFIDARSVSIQEAVFKTTDLPMQFSKPKVIFIPSDMPKDRHGMLKFKKDLDQLPDDSDDIFMKGYIDRYANRPDSLHDICYKDFAANYERCPKVTKSNSARVIVLKDPALGKMIKRTEPQVVRSHTPSRQKDPEKYYYSKICLYFPWTSETEILGSFSSYETSFSAKFPIIKQNMAKFEQIDDEKLDALIAEISKELIENHDSANPAGDMLDPRGLTSHPPDHLKTSENVENCKFTYEEPPITEEDYLHMVGCLNDQQRSIFEMVSNHAQQTHDGNKVNQLIHFISGAGGVGKSYLISAIRHCINRTFKRGSHNSAVLVSASTGVAAALIDGQTIHQLLQLDCQESGFFNQKSLSSAKRDKMFTSIFKNVRYLIIDEVSMIGNTNLNQIHSRLNQLYGLSGQNDFFGGINIIFVGDLFQIPPVQQTKIFDPRGLAALGVNYWTDFVTFSELTDVVRSKGDAPFTQLTHRLRIGQHSTADVNILMSRVIPKMPCISELMDCMLLFSTNKKCSEHNDNCVAHLKTATHVTDIRSHDKFSNEQFNNVNQVDKRDKKDIADYIVDDINKTAGLPTVVPLGVGARVMVRSNINVTDKICNGVCGTVKYIKFKKQEAAPPSEPHHSVSAKAVDKVFIKFDNDKVGRKIKHTCNKFCHQNCSLIGTVPIAPLEKQYKCKKVRKTNVWLKRYQLPLTLCWASTIHKCQGVTLQKAFIDLSGINWKSGMAYTAISRLTSLNGLFLISFDANCIRTDPQIVQEYRRLRALKPFILSTASHLRKPSTKSPINEQLMSTPTASPSSSTETSTNLSTSPPKRHCKRPASNSPAMPCPAKSRRLLSPEHSRSSPSSFNFSDVPVTTLPSNSRAFVVDFNDDPESHRVASLLQSLGFNTRTAILKIQQSVSCGYIAARVVSKLNSAVLNNQNCFDIEVLDCNYSGSDDTGQNLDMVAIANINLRLPGVLPHFLYSSQCIQLIHFYSIFFYNCPIATLSFHDLHIELPLSKSAFLHRLNQIVQSQKHLPPSFFIVNASDGAGTHWFVVALEIPIDRPPNED